MVNMLLQPSQMNNYHLLSSQAICSLANDGDDLPYCQPPDLTRQTSDPSVPRAALHLPGHAAPAGSGEDPRSGEPPAGAARGGRGAQGEAALRAGAAGKLAKRYTVCGCSAVTTWCNH